MIRGKDHIPKKLIRSIQEPDVCDRMMWRISTVNMRRDRRKAANLKTDL